MDSSSINETMHFSDECIRHGSTIIGITKARILGGKGQGGLGRAGRAGREGRAGGQGGQAGIFIGRAPRPLHCLLCRVTVNATVKLQAPIHSLLLKISSFLFMMRSFLTQESNTVT